MWTGSQAEAAAHEKEAELETANADFDAKVFMLISCYLNIPL